MKTITLSRALDILSGSAALLLNGTAVDLHIDDEDSDDGAHVFLTVWWIDDHFTRHEYVFRDEDNAEPKVDGSRLILRSSTDDREHAFTVLTVMPAARLEA